MQNGTNPSGKHERSSATRAIHADDHLNSAQVQDVAPAMHVSTNFRFTDNAEDLVPCDELDVRDGRDWAKLFFNV